MNLSSCGTAALIKVLSIFFLLAFSLSGVDAVDSDYLLPRCPNASLNVPPWWDPLRARADNHQDPCILFKSIRDRDDYAVDCCFEDSGKTRLRRDDHHHNDDKKTCGPCNVQTYNLAAACKACESFTGSGAPIEGNLLAIPGFPSYNFWITHEDPKRSHIFDGLPSWTNVSASSGGLFDVAQVLQAATTGATVSGTFPSPPASTGVSNPSKPNDSSPATSDSDSDSDSSDPPSGYMMKQNSTPSWSKMHAGAIAGGVIGGIVFMALLLLCMIYLMRSRRRSARGAPSAQFMSVAGPGLSPTRDMEDNARFDPGSRPSPLEKWPSTGTGTSQHGLMSNPSPWVRDIEKY